MEIDFISNNNGLPRRSSIAATDAVPQSCSGHKPCRALDIWYKMTFPAQQPLDRSGQGNNGTIINAATQTTGKVGGALNFNGGSKYVTIPDSLTLTYQTQSQLVLDKPVCKLRWVRRSSYK